MTAGSLADGGHAGACPAGPAPAWALGAAAAAALALALLTTAATIGIVAGIPLGGAPAAYGPPAGAVAGIPPQYASLYVQAASRYGLDWAILAGIGKLECDHGRDPDPSCTREGAVNSAGAGGPAQFLEPTWRRYGVDGDGDGTADRWDPADAIFAMANYLRASGAPADYEQAIFAYNHSLSYVAQVERWAARYRAAAHADQTGAGGSDGASGSKGAGSSEGAGAEAANSGGWGGAEPPVQLTPGPRAELSPGDGHVALAPAQAPPVVQAMVIAGNELQDLPYGTSGHPDPRGAGSEDCSSTVNYVLYRSGVRPIAEIVRENPLAQDYVHWGAPGPGRWVTVYAATQPSDHAFIVIAGLRLDTSHDGTDVGPNRDQDGPRWRILDRIPAWARWSVRHPPGL